MKNTNIEIVKCDAKRLQELVDKSAFTLEGLAESSFGELLDWIEQFTKLKARRVFLTAGALANSEWELRGDNAYPGDLNIVSVLLDDMEDFNKVVIPRFQIGARWMDDIRDNNVRREKERG